MTSPSPERRRAATYLKELKKSRSAAGKARTEAQVEAQIKKEEGTKHTLKFEGATHQYEGSPTKIKKDGIRFVVDRFDRQANKKGEVIIEPVRWVPSVPPQIMRCEPSVDQTRKPTDISCKVVAVPEPELISLSAVNRACINQLAVSGQIGEIEVEADVADLIEYERAAFYQLLDSYIMGDKEWGRLTIVGVRGVALHGDSITLKVQFKVKGLSQWRAETKVTKAKNKSKARRVKKQS